MPVCSPDIRARDLKIPDLRACRHADPDFCGAANRQQMKLDRVVRFMNATLLELECVRGQRRSLATRWHASRALILRALRFLGSARRTFAHDAVLWERLHALTTSYYPALNAAYRVRENCRLSTDR